MSVHECNKCSIKLNETNWSSRNQKRGSKICRKCESKISSESQKKLCREYKKIVYEHYGMKCECCKESTKEFLSLEHKSGGGRIERKKFGRRIYKHIIRLGFPKYIGLLCYNCNVSKNLYGFCHGTKPSDDDYIDIDILLEIKTNYKSSSDNMRCKKCNISLTRDVINKRNWYICDGCYIEYKSAYQRSKNRTIRLEIIKHYGSRCCCCNEKRTHFLSIDHIYGNGSIHRKSFKNLRYYYRWILKNKPNWLRLLCYNCNMAKGFFGYCPHDSTDEVSHAVCK